MLHISKYFPNAKFYPLVININHKNVKNSAEKIEEIIISSNINGNTLFIASVDFSHNAPENIAIQRDEETLKKMQE
ncbi:MAG: AmmeMemoRadiSam system protein B [Candidatus Peribacteria bacterium]|jgi:AmmeMemoRadiSam system protein B|nr:AmmeMemoRadiSam system protein B [Candidatus Peribacteria bacterium]